MNAADLIDVWVSPEGMNLMADDFSPAENDDSFKKAKTAFCKECEELLEVAYDEPTASCKCSSQEWYL